MDANPLNYWLSKFFQEVANSEVKVYPARIFYRIICGIRRFAIFRCYLDAEMKDSTRQGVSLQTKGERLFGRGTAKPLLDIIYSYNGKIFGSRGGEHWEICVNNFSLGPNAIKFEENVCKSFHRGITDLKYERRKVRPKSKTLSFENSPVGINTLNCLRVT
ncbi:unnamed protein product [Pocillopora meandrina]|uniref:Uncharacterized protein n=1 Tax=Pocillopora meandrina TaxID=46732 RepID=A0AAU9WHK2_9CNID|nr:unnamed protein product [Pocillopora meandrina]